MHSVALIMILAFVPPLTEEQVIRLETAADGYDVREEAFFALIEHARSWSDAPGDQPVRLNPDFEEMLREPHRYRGDLCLIEGRLAQQAVLDPPYDVAHEWFIRTESGRPIAVYVVGLDDEAAGAFRDGMSVRVYARFYKRMNEIARDGAERSYPAFVGALPESLRPAQPGMHGLTDAWIVLVPVLILLLVFALVLMYVRSQKRKARRERPRALMRLDADESEQAPLPEDPAEALAELKRRQDAEA